ncbi:MAG: hypothetical protein IIC81_06545, partial [Chloroflexi bacterium]|nr:hypothetical protein [Chloroflexota bacterium]
IIVVVIDNTTVNNTFDFATLVTLASTDETDGIFLCEGSSTALAVAACFGSVDFSLLVPDTLSSEPNHSDETIAVAFSTDDTIPSLTVNDVNRAGDTLELYTDTNITTGDGLAAWSFNDVILLLIDESDY